MRASLDAFSTRLPQAGNSQQITAPITAGSIRAILDGISKRNTNDFAARRDAHAAFLAGSQLQSALNSMTSNQRATTEAAIAAFYKEYAFLGEAVAKASSTLVKSALLGGEATFASRIDVREEAATASSLRQQAGRRRSWVEVVADAEATFRRRVRPMPQSQEAPARVETARTRPQAPAVTARPRAAVSQSVSSDHAVALRLQQQFDREVRRPVPVSTFESYVRSVESTTKYGDSLTLQVMADLAHATIEVQYDRPRVGQAPILVVRPRTGSTTTIRVRYNGGHYFGVNGKEYMKRVGDCQYDTVRALLAGKSPWADVTAQRKAVARALPAYREFVTDNPDVVLY